MISGDAFFLDFFDILAQDGIEGSGLYAKDGFQDGASGTGEGRRSCHCH